MPFSAVQGLIERRLLVNYRVDADVLRRLLPRPFRPKLVAGHGVAGVCLIRLTGVRPRLWPARLGLTSENAAHRFAVEWDTPDGPREGVYIPRRDTSSRFNACIGGRWFPGRHHLASFDVTDTGNEVRVALRSHDDTTRVVVDAAVAEHLPDDSMFPSVEAASQFFERGAIGYSATARPDHFDCLELRCSGWRVQALTVRHVESSFFADPRAFPPGSAQFDCALLMRRIHHEWRAGAPLLSV